MAKINAKFKYAKNLISRKGLTLRQANAKVKHKFGAGLDAVAFNTLKSTKPGRKVTTVGVAKRKRTFAERRIKKGISNEEIQAEARKRYGTTISNSMLSKIRKELKDGAVKAAAKKKTSKKKTSKKKTSKMTAPQSPKANGVSEALHLMLESTCELMKHEGIESMEINKNGDVSLDIRRVEVSNLQIRV
jgi:hypothetical protein